MDDERIESLEDREETPMASEKANRWL